MGKLTTWAVTWSPADDTDTQVIDGCLTEEGYSTVADFPVMLSIKYGRPASNIMIHAIVRVEG